MTHRQRAYRFLMAWYGLPVDEDRLNMLEKEFDEAVKNPAPVPAKRGSGGE
jgi:hypothetical protein